MDLNQEYAAHQKALMKASAAETGADREGHAAKANCIAQRIESFQMTLGAAAACAWSTAQMASSVQD